MKTVLFCLAALILTTTMTAQITITGKVTDAQGQGLIGANVYLQNTYDGATSDREGNFSLITDESGEHILNIEYIGFESIRQEVSLNKRIVSLPPFEMKEEFNELDAVTITAGTFEAGDKKKSVSLNSLDMVTTAGAAGDVIGALQALPGTTTVGESGRLFVKGGHSRESKTYIDGTLVYAPYSSSVPNSSVRGRFSPFMFSGTMFSTGGYSAEYGQALSSVLALQTNAMPVQDQLNISLLSVGAELGGTKTWDRASVTTTLSYNNLAPYMKLVPQYRKWDKEPQTILGDMSIRVKTGKSGMLKLYANTNQSHLITMEENLDYPGTTSKYSLINNNSFINGSWIGEVAEDWILTGGFSYTNNEDKIAVDSLRINEHLKGSHGKVTIKHKLTEKAKVLAGAELYSRTYRVDYPSLDHLSSLEFRNNTLAGFVESELYASTRLVGRIGARMEFSDYLKKFSLAPRISAAYKVAEKSQFSLSYGWFFQDPEDELLLHSDNFEYERADHITLNYIMKGDLRVLRTELYFKDYKDLVKYDYEGEQIYPGMSNKGHGYAYGLDLFWRDRKSVQNGEYWISYSYIETKRDFRDYPELAVPGFASKHNLALVYKHWINRLRSKVGATYRYSSPRVYNNPNSAEFNAERTLAYRSLDVNWSYVHRSNVIFYFSVTNVLGYEQQFGHTYASVPDSEGFYRSAPKLPGAKRFFILGCFITLSKSGKINQLDKIN